MINSTEKIGRDGEDAAEKFLIKQGYKILERNARFGKLEIDIVAYDRKRKMHVFIEVKTRSKNSSAYPTRTAVDARKRRTFREAVFHWSVKNDFDGPGRLDVISMSDDKVTEHLIDLGSDFY